MNEQAFDIAPDASIADFFRRIFASDFMPHGHCYFWRPDVLWLHVGSDFMIAVAYVCIPVTLIYFHLKRRDIPFHGLFYLFAAFIILCGMTHMVNIYTTWYPMYRLEGFVKLITGIVSLATAAVLIPVMPHLLRLPNYRVINRNLAEKTKELESTNEELEKFNSFAVGREKEILRLKGEVNQLLKERGKQPRYRLTES